MPRLGVTYIMSDTYASSQAGVMVQKRLEGGGNLMYVVFESRPAFDLIDLAMTDHGVKRDGRGHVLSKNIDHDGQYIIFQYWLEEPTP
jgi:hypothetical protein